MSDRAITIAIPTLGRPSVLARTLERLLHQRAATPPFDVVVASDAADPDRGASGQVVKVAAARGLIARHVSAARAGASAARNAAWRDASAELVLFLGDDMLPTPGLVAAHVETHARHRELGDAVLGHVRWAPELRVTPFMRWLDRGVHFDWATIPESGVGGWWHFYTANVSVKRALLERVGGFDEAEFPFHYEDIELAARMNEEAGLRPYYRADAVVEHLHPTTLDDWRSRLRGIAAAERRFVTRYPQWPPYFHDLFAAAMRAPRAKGRGARLARVIPPSVPWLGPRAWSSVDAYYAQLLAPEFMAGWSEAGQPEPSEETSNPTGSPPIGPK